MLTAHETQLILEKFFAECLRYWKMQGKDEREAFERALNDTKHVDHNPYVPIGDKIDTETKEKFIHYREMDLGKEK